MSRERKSSWERVLNQDHKRQRGVLLVDAEENSDNETGKGIIVDKDKTENQNKEDTRPLAERLREQKELCQIQQQNPASNADPTAAQSIATLQEIDIEFLDALERRKEETRRAEREQEAAKLREFKQSKAEIETKLSKLGQSASAKELLGNLTNGTVMDQDNRDSDMIVQNKKIKTEHSNQTSRFEEKRKALGVVGVVVKKRSLS